jgi:hypothetical protein
MTTRILTQEELRSQLNYDPDTGIFTRIIANSSKNKVNDIAGCLRKSGYVELSINNKLHYAHRLAWLYMTGEMPKHHIDHINHNKSDNRFINLRQATSKQNGFNQKLRINNKSGYKGVSFCKARNKWNAFSRLHDKTIYLGSYLSPELASQAYQEFAKKHHGEFYFEHNARV